MKKLLAIVSLLAFVGCAAPRTSIEAKNVSGTMLFKVKPSDADIAVDGNVIGKAREFDGSSKVAKVGPGKHVISVSKPGYVTWESRVYLSDSQEMVEVDLQKEGN